MSKLVKNSMLYLTATIFLKGASFLLLPLYTKLVSPEEYGVVYLITTLGTFLSLLLSLSVRGAVSRFYFDNKQQEALKELYSCIVIFIFGFATISYLIIFAFVNPISDFMDISNPLYLTFALIGSYASVFFPIILALLYVQEKGKLISLITILIGSFSIIMQLLLVLNMQDKIMAFMISLLINGLLQLSLFIFFSRKYFVFNLKFKNIKKYLTYSLHSLPGDISVWIITFADRIMIDKYKGHADTGLYSIGYKLGQSPEILFQSINKAYVPYVYNKYSDFNDENRNNTIKVGTFLFTLFTGFIFVITVFSKDIVRLLNTSYKDSLWIMVIILFSYLLSGYKLIFHNPLSFNEKFLKYKSGIWIFAAILNIALNFWLIPKYSMYGAAIATLISYIVTLIPVLILSNRAIKINYPIKKYFVILIISIIYFMSIMLDVTLCNFIIKILITIIYTWVLIKLSDFNIGFYLNNILNKIWRKG